MHQEAYKKEEQKALFEGAKRLGSETAKIKHNKGIK